MEGENQGSEIRVNPPRTLVVGRSESCDIFLSEKKISRKHCKIHVKEDGIVLEDLGSTNGTLLNRRQVKGSEPLSSEDLLQVGTSLIKLSVEYQKEAEPQEAPPSDTPTKEEKADDAFDTEFEGSSGVMPAMEEPSRSMGMTAVTREQIPVPEAVPSNPVEKKAKPLSGDLSAMGVADLVQNLAQNSKSGILSLNMGQGEITVVEGKILGAKAGKVLHRKAFYRMLTWHEGEFEFLPLPPGFKASDVKEPMSDQVETLLMEGFRQFDELSKLQKRLPSLRAKLRLKSKIEPPLSKLHPKVLDVLQLVINQGEFQSILDSHKESDLEISKMIYYLLKKEYIEST